MEQTLRVKRETKEKDILGLKEQRRRVKKNNREKYEIL